jgi:hypothetical protein
MISKDLIKENIPEIQEDHIDSIVELVNNTYEKELKTEIDKVRGTTFGLVDETLKEFGYPKQSGKTTEHLQNVLTTLKEGMMTDDTRKKLTELEEANKKLQDELKSANPDIEKLKQDYDHKLEVLNASLQEKEELFNTEKDKHKKDLIKLQLRANLPKIKDSIGEKTKELHLNKAIGDLIESADLDENGKVIFRDSDNNVLYNTANKNNPFTIQEMFEKNEYLKEIVDTGQKKTGLNSNNYKPNEKFTLNLSGAKTRMEADALIEKSLIAKGMTKLDDNWQEEFTKIRQENKVEQLPIR